MDHSTYKSFKHMEMSIDNTNMLISIRTEVLQKFEESSYSIKLNDYVISTNTPAFNRPIGDLLFSFINADFTTLGGFESYISVWGLSGLLKVNRDQNNPHFYQSHYNSTDAKETILSFYNLTNSSLINAQADFRNVVDFCINAEKKPYLMDLTPPQRYYIGRFKNIIPTLDAYSTAYNVYYHTDRTYITYDDIKNDYSIEELCNSVREDNFIVKSSYYSQNILTFAYIEFFNLLSNFSISKCDNCSKYFVPKTKINEIYCEDCRFIGYINKVKNDEFLKAYNTAYKTRHAEKQRNINGKSEATRKKYETALKKWREEAKYKLKLVREGMISEESFKDYLNSKLEV